MHDSKVGQALTSLRSTVYNLETLVQGTDDQHTRSLCDRLQQQIGLIEGILETQKPEE